ncbi:LysM peptidoglycan-binding domain-containing protein [Paenibacillus tarimensis]
MTSWKKYIVGGTIAALLTVSAGSVSAASYTVQPNDSLWLIAVKNGTTVEKLKQMNGLTRDWIMTGEKLQVPDPQGFTTISVRPDDTMWKISQRYGVPLSKLIRANPQIPNPSIIWGGLTVRIPLKPAAYPDGVFPLAAGTFSPFPNNYAEAREWSPDSPAVRAHEGVDIFADKGTPVYSVLDGTIVRYGWNQYGGWRLTIRVDDNTDFYYAHLSAYAPGLKAGDKVKKGQLIGYVGSSGYGPEGTEGKFLPHLHFGIYKRTPTYRPIDPFLYLKWWQL